MFDVIEHTNDPIANLKIAHKLLKPGGFLMIGIPDFGHYKVRRFKEKWSNFTPPEHLFYFTADTLRKACKISGLEFHKRLLRSPFRDSLKIVFKKAEM